MISRLNTCFAFLVMTCLTFAQIICANEPSILDDPFLISLLEDNEQNKQPQTVNQEEGDVASFPGHPSSGGYQHPYTPYQKSTTPPKTTPRFDNTASLDQGIVINFENVEIIAYLKWISNLIKVNFIFDEAELKFRISIVSNEPATRENIMASLLQILRIHDLSLVEQGNNIIIHKNQAEGASSSSAVLLSENENISGNTGLVTKVFQLHHINPSSISKALEGMLSSKALLQVADDTRHMIVTDLSVNVEKISTLLQALDTPNNTLDIGTYKVKAMNIASLVALSKKIVDPLANGNTLVLVPQPSTSTIFIISTPYLIEKVLSVLSTLDGAPPPQNTNSEDDEEDDLPDPSSEDLPPGHIDSTQFKNYELQYRHGGEIQNALLKIGDSLSAAGNANQDLVSTIQTVEWLISTNSLVFSGTPQAISRLEQLIETLDVPTKEVFIEMLIIETTVTNSLQFGVQLGYRDTNERFASAGTFTSPAIEKGLDSVTFDGIPNAATLMDPNSFSLGVLGKAIVHDDQTFTSIGALVKALNQEGNTKIIMNPQIVTQNNSPAEQFVGTTNRFASTSIQSVEGSFAQVNYEYRQIGSRIVVTPTLTNSDIVTLDIDQQIQVALNSSNASDSADAALQLGPVATTKTIRTRVHVPDRYFLVLSGMISENKQSSRARIPCLGSLSGIGGTFSQTVNSDDRYNMMIFIRPHIISSPEDIKKITKQQKERVEKSHKGFNKQFEEESLMNLLNIKK